MTADDLMAIRRTARLAGVLYLCLVPLGIFSFIYVPSLIMVPGDAAATGRNILTSEWIFRLGTASHLLSQVIVVFLVLALYRIFRPVNPDRAMAMVVLALLCVPISFVSEVNALGAAHLLADGRAVTATSPPLDAQAMQLLSMQRSGVLLAQVFWGLWMVPLATLIFTSGFLPRWLSVPVLVASAGYLFDSSAHILLPGSATISRFTAAGELVLPLWLLAKGIDAPRWQRSSVR
ncbi:MAG TPA: DUF4386 domain-containing protein [Trueperaceae bacterium]